jgi:hypothetical protein
MIGICHFFCKPFIDYITIRNLRLTSLTYISDLLDILNKEKRSKSIRKG